MIFKYKGYGYKLRQRNQNQIYYKVKKLKWRWYKRSEVLKINYDPMHELHVERIENEVTEEFIRRTHEVAQLKIDEFVARDEELIKMKEMLHEPNMEFLSRIMK